LFFTAKTAVRAIGALSPAAQAAPPCTTEPKQTAPPSRPTPTELLRPTTCALADVPPHGVLLPPTFGDAADRVLDALAMTDGDTATSPTADMGSYILMATKEDLRKLGDDPTQIPLVLLYKGEILVSNDMTPLSIGVSTILQEFEDVFLEEVPAELLPMRGIEHQIDLIPGATLPNRAPYRTNPDETK
jgi:hypothetical protein